MERKETIEFMNRIKQHYQEFIIDEGKIKEWHKELSKYEADDVNSELDKHLKSEYYGNTIPKLYFLTKHLTTIEDKNRIIEYNIECPNCGIRLNYAEFEKHTKRCNSVKYIMWLRDKMGYQKIDRNALMNCSDEKFEELYMYMLNRRYECPDISTAERKRLECILYGKTFDISELIG